VVVYSFIDITNIIKFPSISQRLKAIIFRYFYKDFVFRQIYLSNCFVMIIIIVIIVPFEENSNEAERLVLPECDETNNFMWFGV